MNKLCTERVPWLKGREGGGIGGRVNMECFGFNFRDLSFLGRVKGRGRVVNMIPTFLSVSNTVPVSSHDRRMETKNRSQEPENALQFLRRGSKKKKNSKPPPAPYWFGLPGSPSVLGSFPFWEIARSPALVGMLSSWTQHPEVKTKGIDPCPAEALKPPPAPIPIPHFPIAAGLGLGAVAVSSVVL